VLLCPLFVVTILGCRSDVPPFAEERSTLTLRVDASDWIFRPMEDYYELDLMFLPLAAFNDRGELQGSAGPELGALTE